MRPSWKDRIKWMRRKAEEVRPEPTKIRDRMGTERAKTNAQSHVPSLANLLCRYEMGGQGWIQQFAEGFPIIGNLAEAGVYPTTAAEDPKLSRQRALGR